MNGLKEMALEAQLPHNFYTGEPMWMDRLEHFAKLAVEKEREACAKVCHDASVPLQGELQSDAQWSALCLATTIRARS